MVNRCTDIPRLLWLANVIIALAHTGLRISELAGLRWSDVDFNSNTIRVADERSSRRNPKEALAFLERSSPNAVRPPNDVCRHQRSCKNIPGPASAVAVITAQHHPA